MPARVNPTNHDHPGLAKVVEDKTKRRWRIGRRYSDKRIEAAGFTIIHVERDKVGISKRPMLNWNYPIYEFEGRS